MSYLTDEITKGYARGWSFTPLNGKRPILPEWQKQPRETLEQALEWAEQGNVGLRTGATSGIVVIDIDPGADEDIYSTLPETVIARTGRDGYHYYYTLDKPLQNSASKFAPHVDIKADRGQVVFVGSVHPDTNKQYEWHCHPDSTTIAPLPECIYQKLTALPERMTRPATSSTKYDRAALSKELEILYTCPEGVRSVTLNTAAFNLGQLIASGRLDRGEVEAALWNTIVAAGWKINHTKEKHTIKGGIDAGIEKPRAALVPRASTKPVETSETIDVLTPGTHVTDQGEYIEQGTDDFTSSVLRKLPPGVVYAKAGLPGQIAGEPGVRKFKPLNEDHARQLIDEYMRLGHWKTVEEEQTLAYVTCNNDLAGLILSSVDAHPLVRQLEILTNYPIYGRKWTRSEPGYHEGFYYDQPAELVGLDPITDSETIQTVLDDLLVDFPFKDEASRQNFLGLMLTPIVRPALAGNTPLHLILASLERTGKTKLAEEVLGGVLLGHSTPALQLNQDDSEIEKRILSILLDEDPIVHCDNLKEFVDSPALASVLTASKFKGRKLGESTMKTISNYLTIVGSGNNVKLSGELAKRTVPIVLQPKNDEPEARTDFRHPNLGEYVTGVRKTVMGCLVGMVENWIAAGRPRHAIRLGGFDNWSETVGGILEVAGYHDWFTNVRQWVRSANPQGEDLRLLVKTWAEAGGTWKPFSTGELAMLARESNLFTEAFTPRTEAAQVVAFGRKVMQRFTDVPVGDFVIRKIGTGGQCSYKLERNE